VQATLLNEEYKAFLQNRERKILTQVFQAGWISDYADPYSFLNLFRTGHGRNDYGYSNTLYDALLDEVAAERIPSRRRRLMFETERLLLADVPMIPLYTDVTKRMVNPRLKGWQSNVMDHHYSKDMFFLKAASDETPAAVDKIEVIAAETEESTAADSIEVITVPVAGDNAVLIEENADPVLPEGDAETVEPAQDPGLVPLLEENETEAPREDVSVDALTTDETRPEDPIE